MIFKDKAGRAGSRTEGNRSCELGNLCGSAKGPDPVRNSELEPELQEALREFRLSVNSWSEAILNRPRPLLAAAPRRLPWRQTAIWALGCALIAASVSGGVYEQRQRQESARVSALRAIEQSRAVADQQAQQAKEEDLLVRVDSEVSREVPAAMEPLARLMAEDESK